ncbi:MAG: sugar transferase [Alistipes sp.]
MRYPLLYIKGRGRYTARFMEITEGRLLIVPDINSAMKVLVPVKSEHAFILYEQKDFKIDVQNIQFLRSWFAGCGIILIAEDLDNDERKAYLQAGVNSAVHGDVDKESFLHTLQFMTDYTFKHKPVLAEQKQIKLSTTPLWKRTFDIVVSLCALLVLSPVLLLTALAIKCDGPGPILYKSKRVGSNYKVFDFLKFRSMRTNADKKLKKYNALNQYATTETDDVEKVALSNEDLSSIVANMGEDMLFSDDFVIPENEHLHEVNTTQKNAFVKIENDPRVTRVGAILRKYSIDELPQLINILRGDMSVVGNRPLPLYEAERLTGDEYIERFMCPSGLTGLWQVKKRGGAGKLSPEQRKQLDIKYAKTMSPWLDFKIILQTFTAFIQKENV